MNSDKLKGEEYFALIFRDDQFIFLDQTRLPNEENYIITEDYNRIAEAIERLEIRGAPAIGVAAAYALSLSIKNLSENSLQIKRDAFQTAYNRLARTRPTAVNLFYALDEIKKVFEANENAEKLYSLLKNAAIKIHEDDIEKCRRIGENGLVIFKKKSTVLTHCNTGKLATGGDGTAFNVIKRGFQNELVSFVYADETRPLLQGSRLTAYELDKNGIPFAIQSDSSAAVLMAEGKIDLVITGADRIASNGDSANKIGTYNLAVLCKYHNIPFYIAAPTTTIDKSITSGKEIKIEFRNKAELISIKDVKISRENYSAFTPAFDVTPAELITGIITEEKVHYFPYSF